MVWPLWFTSHIYQSIIFEEIWPIFLVFKLCFILETVNQIEPKGLHKSEEISPKSCVNKLLMSLTYQAVSLAVTSFAVTIIISTHTFRQAKKPLSMYWIMEGLTTSTPVLHYNHQYYDTTTDRSTKADLRHANFYWIK